MNPTAEQKKEEKKEIDLLFRWSMLIKGVNALFEVVSGIAVLFLTTNGVLHIIQSLTQGELANDPNDPFANWALDIASRYTPATNHFLFYYLISHGVVKLFLVVSLLKGKKWAYPLSLTVFGLFIVYQLWRFAFTHSVWLAVLTVFDVLVVWLIWREYLYHRRKRARPL